MTERITELADKIFGRENISPELSFKLEKFARGVAQVEHARVQTAYEKLSMIHSETMLELIETRKQLERRTLWWDIKRKIKRVLRSRK